MIERFVKRTPIHKGWSGDQKYCAETAAGEKYLLRISPIERKDARARMFEMQKKVAELGIPMCRPVHFGTCPEGVYTVQTWIDGEDAEPLIPTLPVLSVIRDLLISLDLFTRFNGFTYGHLDLPTLVFYLSFAAFFLFLTVQSMEKRRRV